ncbi:MAG: Uma2 family endonuclease, partial [Bacteroidota bacterium]|nr:Uma2 family endonuclease [Bacteroidota bacterium]
MITDQTVPRTALEVFEMLPEGTRCEVINNLLYMSPAPTSYHQWLQTILTIEIGNRIKGKARVLPTVDTFFETQQSAFQPDLIVVLNSNLDIIRENGIYGAPDVVIEILSGDQKRDLIKKKFVYEKGGVKEYFVVNPE